MPVFNEIDFDGRVERCAAAVARHLPVTVYALDSGKPYQPVGFAARRVLIPALGMMRPFLFWIGFVWFALRMRPTVIHAHDYFMAFPAWLAARLTGARFIYDAHELIVPAPGERRRLSETIFYGLERLVIGRADAVIAANAARAEIMAVHYALRDTPAVVRNIPAPEPGDPTAEAAPLPGLPPKRPGAFRLVYQGYLAERFHLDRYVRAVAMLGPNFEMVMAGPGPAAPALAALAARECPDRVHLLGRVPRRFLPAILRTGDVGIIVYGNESLNEIHCAPNKVFEYARAGLPSVGNDNPGLRTIIETEDIGTVGDDALDTVRRIVARHAEFKANLDRFLERNSWHKEEERLMRVYDRLDLSGGVR